MKLTLIWMVNVNITFLKKNYTLLQTFSECLFFLIRTDIFFFFIYSLILKKIPHKINSTLCGNLKKD